jgi:hypothetical protein
MNRRTCGPSMHRTALLASAEAAYLHCLNESSPGSITDWIDGDPVGDTALCPHCGIDAVVGFDGAVDTEWLPAAHKRSFG